MKQVILAVFLLFSILGFSQELGEKLVDTTQVINWYEKYPRPYAGEYHFGFSEGESTLRIIYARKTLVAQIKWSEWDDSKATFISHYKTLTNVHIDDGGVFYSDEHTGRFIYYIDNDLKKKGLRIDNPWGPTFYEDKYEIGLRYNHIISLNGNYSEASLKLIPQDKLNAMTAAELKLMRNEIFARYGYIFRVGGEMESYFKKQDWYQPAHVNVDDCLTLIEKENISRIRIAEKRK